MKQHLEVNCLEVRQVRSGHGRTDYQQRVLRGLGLRGIGSSVTVDNTPAFRGMIKRVLHLVVCQEKKSPEKESVHAQA